MKNLTFIVPVYKHEPSFFIKLASYYKSIQFIIVFTKHEFPINNKMDNIEIIYKSGIGFGEAINIALKRAKGEYIIISNDDICFDYHILNNIQEYDVQIPIIKKTNGQIDSIGSFLNFFCFNINNKSYKRKKELLITGTFFIIKRELFNKLKGFDNRFFMYYEDTDISLRILYINIKIHINKKLEIIHKGSFSDLINKNYYLKRNRIYLILKHCLYKKKFRIFLFIPFELFFSLFQLLKGDFNGLSVYRDAYSMYKNWKIYESIN